MAAPARKKAESIEIHPQVASEMLQLRAALEEAEVMLRFTRDRLVTANAQIRSLNEEIKRFKENSE